MTNRNEVIDFIRGLSILSVILLHCKIHLGIDQSMLSIIWVKWILSSGYYGVMVFFVVSGFLITSTCIRKWQQLHAINLGQFYLMRFARIAPCLIALLAILSLLHAMGIKDFVIQNTSLQQSLFSALTFRMNSLEATVGYLPGNWDVLWSLSVEEMFYFFFPLICFVFRKPKQLMFMLFILILLGPLARTKFTDNDIWSDHSYLSCMDGIAIGCLAAMIADKVKSMVLSKFLLMIGCLFVIFIFFFRKQAFDIGITSMGLNVTLLEMGIAMVILATQRTSFKWFGFIQWFGRNSYEVYLTHSFVVLLAANIFYRPDQPIGLIIIEYVLIVLSSGLLGQLIAVCYSEPLNRYVREKSVALKMRYSEGL